MKCFSFLFVLLTTLVVPTYTEEATLKTLRYQLRKLSYNVHIINTLYEDKILHLPTEYKELDSGNLLVEGYEFSENYIINALKHMCDYNDFSPLLLIWQAFTQYKHLQESEPLKEFTLAIICVLKSTVRHHDPDLYPEWIAHESLKNNAITLSQALEILDVLVHELPPFFDQYEISSNLSWQSWAQKYWLVFPFALAALLIKTYLSAVK